MRKHIATGGYICFQCLKDTNNPWSSLTRARNAIHGLAISHLPKQLQKTRKYHVESFFNKRSKTNNNTRICRRYHTLSNGQTLHQEYQKLLVYLIKNNFDSIQKFLNDHNEIHKDTTDTIFSKPESHELDMLQSLVDDSFLIDQSIRQIGSLLNKNYKNVSLERSKFSRYDAPLTDYNWFLTQLYPRGGNINYSKLYDAYNALPTPRPFHIAHKHLEDLLSAFMSPAKKTEATRAIFANILNDVEESGMPLSHHEINSILEMTLKGYQEDIDMVTQMRKLGNDTIKGEDSIPPLSQTLNESEFNSDNVAFFQSELTSFLPSLEQLRKLYNKITVHNQRDISTINILYRFSLKSNDAPLATKSLNPLRNGEVIPDRITFIIELMQAGSTGDSKKVKEIYQEMISRNVTIDITVMNVMIKSLLRAGDIRSAESLFDFLLKQEDKRREKKNNEDQSDNDQVFSLLKAQGDAFESIRPNIPIEGSLMNKLRMIDFVQLVIKSQNSKSPKNLDTNSMPVTDIQKMVPLIPNSHTFGSLFSYYCLKSNDASKVSSLIMSMQKYNIPLTEVHFRLIFRGFVGDSSRTISLENGKTNAHDSSKDEQVAKRRITWNSSFLQHVTQLMYNQHDALVQLSFTPGSSNASTFGFNINNTMASITENSLSSQHLSVDPSRNPFTTRVCWYMFRAYEEVYWYKKMDIEVIKQSYRAALQPATNEMELSNSTQHSQKEVASAIPGSYVVGTPNSTEQNFGQSTPEKSDSNLGSHDSQKDLSEDIAFEEQEAHANQTATLRVRNQASVSSIVYKTVEKLLKLGAPKH